MAVDGVAVDGVAEPGVAELCEAWCTSREARGLSAHSVRGGRVQVLAVARSVAVASDCALEELRLTAWTPAALEAAVAGYRRRPDRRYKGAGGPGERSAGSVRQCVYALQSFGQWLVEQGHLSTSPASGLRAPRVEQSVEVLSLEEAQIVLESAAVSRAPERDTLVVCLALTMGCTLQEIAGLQVRDRRGTQLQLRSGARRQVPLSPAAARAWDMWMPVRTGVLERFEIPSEQLVVSLRPRTLEDGVRTLDTTASGIAELLGRVVGASGLPRGRARLLRATFATLALSSGSHSLAQLRAQLGCTSIESLRPYAELAGVELQSALRAHPLGG